MEIVLHDGCTESSISIDGTDADALTTGQIQDAIANVVATLKRDEAVELLKYAVERFCELFDSYICGTCGDAEYYYERDVPNVWKIDLK